MTHTAQNTSRRSSAVEMEATRIESWREHSRLLERAHAMLNRGQPDRAAAMRLFRRAAEAGDRVAAMYDPLAESAMRAKVLLSAGNCWYRARGLDLAWQALDEARFLAEGTLTAQLAEETLLQIEIARDRAQRASSDFRVSPSSPVRYRTDQSKADSDTSVNRHLRLWSQSGLLICEFSQSAKGAMPLGRKPRESERLDKETLLGPKTGSDSC